MKHRIAESFQIAPTARFTAICGASLRRLLQNLDQNVAAKKYLEGVFLHANTINIVKNKAQIPYQIQQSRLH
jgi:hypothetical protein